MGSVRSMGVALLRSTRHCHARKLGVHKCRVAFPSSL